MYGSLEKLRVPSYSNAFSSTLQLNSHVLFSTKSRSSLQQISAYEMQLCLNLPLCASIGVGGVNLHKKFLRTKVMDPESTLVHCSGMDEHYGSNFAKA